jgi:hypothetical protein
MTEQTQLLDELTVQDRIRDTAMRQKDWDAVQHACREISRITGLLVYLEENEP